MEVLRVRERAASGAAGLARATARQKRSSEPAGDALLREKLRQHSRKQLRCGYRRVGAELRNQGWRVNHKRVQRLWREEGLRVPHRPPKRRRLGQSAVPAQRLRVEHPNQVWALGFMFDTTWDGRPSKVLPLCDEFTRESVGGLPGRSTTADAVVAELDRLWLKRGGPPFIRCDNGPEFVARAIRDWCTMSGSRTSYIDKGSPWQNAYVEGFDSRARAECFAGEIFDTVSEARVLYEDWRRAYNRHHPHSAPGFQAPEVFATAFSQPKLARQLDLAPISCTRATDKLVT